MLLVEQNKTVSRLTKREFVTRHRQKSGGVECRNSTATLTRAVITGLKVAP